MYYLTQLAAKLGKAGAKWAAAGFPLRTPEATRAALDACGDCRHWQRGRCKLCGCVTRFKARMATEHCPLEKWPIVD